MHAKDSMKSEVPCPVKTGIEVVDLRDAAEFQGRRLRVRDLARQRERLQRLGRAFVDSPEMVLQELVDSAVSLCGADSAGNQRRAAQIRPRAEYYHWIATAGRVCGISKRRAATTSECVRRLPGARPAPALSGVATFLRSYGD